MKYAGQKKGARATRPSGKPARRSEPCDEAAPHTAMPCCKACSGAHNLAIAARLASLGALPDSMMLAASYGSAGRSRRNSLRSNSRRAFIARSPDAQPRDNGERPDSDECPAELFDLRLNQLTT